MSISQRPVLRAVNAAFFSNNGQYIFLTHFIRFFAEAPCRFIPCVPGKSKLANMRRAGKPAPGIVRGHDGLFGKHMHGVPGSVVLTAIREDTLESPVSAAYFRKVMAVPPIAGKIYLAAAPGIDDKATPQALISGQPPA